MPQGDDLSTGRSTPVVSFLSDDFDSIREDMRTYAQGQWPDRWTDFNDNQPSVQLLDLLAYGGDLLSYKVNALLREAFPATLRRYQNMINIGAPFGVRPNPQAQATGVLTITLNPDGTYPGTIKTSHLFSNADDNNLVFFHPLTETVVSSYSPTPIEIDVIEGELHSDELIGLSGGGATQKYVLSRGDIVPSSVSVTVGGVSWTEVKDFSSQTPTTNCYVLRYDDAGNIYVIFGDGNYGSIPAGGAEIRATYDVGGGKRGNIARNTITRTVDVPDVILSVTNAAETSNGDNPQPLAQARYAFAGALTIQDRAVAAQDYAQLVQDNVPGVAKVRARPGYPYGSRRVELIIAPSGGGQPTGTIINDALDYLSAGRSGTGKRVKPIPVVYVTVKQSYLLIIDDAYKAKEVSQAVRNVLVSPLADGTGIMDFDKLDFGAVGIGLSGKETRLIAETRIQSALSAVPGLSRLDIRRICPVPYGRERPGGNTGDGLIESITTNGQQRRRQFYVLMMSSSSARVFERSPGFIGEMTDNSITDQECDTFTGKTGWLLVPDADGSTELPIVDVGEHTVYTSGSKLYGTTRPRRRFYVYDPVYTEISVGDTYTSSDSTTTFQLVDGATSFVSGDSFTVDVYPEVSDVRLADDEYPSVLSADITITTSGGKK